MIKLEGLQKEIWEKKYKYKDDNTIEDTWKRVANAIASVEKDKEHWEEAFYNLLYDFKFIPGGRITAGAGTPHNYLLNCASQPVEDSLEGIYETVKRAAVLAKSNYGCGFNFSTLRPKNSGLSKGGTASGPVSFMRVFDTSGSVIETGGGRRAASIAILRVDHPDILEFIEAKRNEGTLTQFNISVGITDKFLKAVKDDTDFDLVFDGKVVQTIKAKSIWDKLIHSGYNYNDPGIFNLDEVARYNNGWYYQTLDSVNPCGEIPLPSTGGVCDLGNINITKFIKKPFTSSSLDDNFDWDGYEKAITTAVRFLDNVLDVSDYPYEDLAESARNDRRIGLNVVAGLGSFLAMMKIPYDSIEARESAMKLQKFAMNAAYITSICLADEKGSFKNFDSDKYVTGRFIEANLAGNIRDIHRIGMRNVSLLTIPPVGTGSILAGNISNGLEPIFALEYNRNVRQVDSSTKVEPVEDYAWRLYKELGKPEGEHPVYFKTSREISPKDHVNVQAALQKYIDGSISKTINMPSTFTIKEYEEVLLYSVEKGCKGFTSFREGTRQGVLETKQENKTKPAEEKIKTTEPKKKRPRILSGKTYKISDDIGNIYVTINNVEDKGKVKPLEIFINSNSETESIYGEWYKALSKIMSAVMRRTDDCAFMVKDLQTIAAPKGYFSDGQYMQSKPQMLGNILEEHIESLQGVKKKEVFTKCPECGEVSFSKEGGCGSCKSCGFSQCG